MTYIEQLGQSQYFLQFDEEFRQRLFAVQGEIGRTYLFSILDKDKKIVANPNITMSMVIQSVVGNTEPTVGQLLSNGQYKITLPQTALYFEGTATYQLKIEENLDDEILYRFLGSKQAIIYIEPNVDFVSKQGENFIFKFMEFKKKMTLIDELIESEDKVLQEVIQARDMAIDILDNIDLAGSVLDKADLINALLAELESRLSAAEINVIYQKIKQKSNIHYQINDNAIEGNSTETNDNDLLMHKYELENAEEVKISRYINGTPVLLYDSAEYVRKQKEPLVYEILNYNNPATNESIKIYSNNICEYWGYRAPLITIRSAYGTVVGLYFTTYEWIYPMTFSKNPMVVLNEARYSTGASWGSVRYANKDSCNLLIVDSHYRPPVGQEVLPTFMRLYVRGEISDIEKERLLTIYRNDV